MPDVAQEMARLTTTVNSMQGELSQLSSVIESLARIEERLANQKDDVDGFGKRLWNFDKRLQQLEIKQAISNNQGSTTARWVERMIMFLVIAALGAFNFFKGS